MRNLDDATIINRNEVATTTQLPQLRETVTFRAPRGTPATSQTYLVTEQWSWRDLRDYVITKMAELGIELDRDPIREASICKGFINRWGDRAKGIARFAFEEREGRWMDQPVTLSRFTKGADPYFAIPISERLVDAPVKGW